MMYLSKGILPWKPSAAGAAVSHCGVLHRLTGDRAALWLAGQHQPGHTQNAEQDAELARLAELGIAECDEGTDETAVFRLLTGCSVCPVRVKSRPAILNRPERRLWRWIRFAGLRLTVAELTLLTERGVKPVPALLGEANRQALTEVIYTAETIFDGILETLAAKSPARAGTVAAVLGLLRKGKIYLI
jgi:hypothetical protein